MQRNECNNYGGLNFMVTDWIVAISTAIYSVVTIAIMRANKKTNNLTKKQIIESNKRFLEQQRLAVRPCLNLYIAREGEKIDDDVHYRIGGDEGNGECYRTFSIRNIGNGMARDVEICIEKMDDLILAQDISGRNCFMLVGKQYVYDNYYKSFKKISFICKYTDSFDNCYQQKMEIYLDKERGELRTHTYKPELLNEGNL